jgi:PEP-CTERM motif-containing protein
MNQLKGMLRIVVVFVFTVAAFVRPADAVLSLYLESGGSQVTVTDGGVGDLDSTAGAVTFVGAVGLFTVNASTGLGAPLLEAPQLLDLNSIDRSSGAGTLTIRLGQDNFSGIDQFLVDIGGTVGRGTGNTFSYNLYIYTGAFDATTLAANDPTALGTLICSGGTFLGGSFSDTNSCSWSGGGSPFSLVLEAIITHTGATVSSFDYATVPEPSAMLLLGVGLIGLVVWIRRRKA